MIRGPSIFLFLSTKKLLWWTIKGTPEKSNKTHLYVQLMGFHYLLSPILSPISAYGFSSPFPFLFSWSSIYYLIPLLQPFSYSVSHFSQLFVYYPNLLLPAPIVSYPFKVTFPTTKWCPPAGRLKWGWKCCLYGSEFVKKVRMRRFYVIYLKGWYILSDQEKTAN